MYTSRTPHPLIALCKGIDDSDIYHTVLYGANIDKLFTKANPLILALEVCPSAGKQQQIDRFNGSLCTSSSSKTRTETRCGY